MIKCETNIAFTALKLIILSPTRYDTFKVELILCLIKQLGNIITISHLSFLLKLYNWKIHTYTVN